MTTIRQCSMVDLAVVEKVIKHPEVYPTAVHSVGMEEFNVRNLLYSGPPIYVLADDSNQFVAVLHPVNQVTWMAHDYALPEIRGRRAFAVCRAMLQWMWDNTPCRKMVGLIPVSHKRALMFSQAVGFTIEGRLSKACCIGGELHDITMVGLCKEQGNG